MCVGQQPRADAWVWRENQAFKYMQLKPWEGLSGGVSAAEGEKLEDREPIGTQVLVSLAGAVSRVEATLPWIEM